MSAKNKTSENIDYTVDECGFVGELDKVPLFIPKIPGQQTQFDIICSAGGKDYLIQRGKTVYVPKNIRDIVLEHLRAEEKADEYYYSQSSKNQPV